MDGRAEAVRLRVLASDAHEGQGRQLAQRLGVPFGHGPAEAVLIVSDDGISAHSGAARTGLDQLVARAVRVDLTRARPGSESVVRAVGGRASTNGVRTVVDASCGWGVDAGALWRAGWQVTAIERDPVVTVLLEDGVRRAHEADPVAAARFVLSTGDARTLLPSLALRPDVVYLDPMYPRTRGGAKRRGAAWLRSWLGEGEASDETEQLDLLRVARSVATRRVVVKRPARAAPLAPGESGSIDGRTTRFDLYAPLTADR